MSTVLPQASASAVPTAQIERCGTDWLFDCEYRQHSAQTIALRRFVVEKLVWFLRLRGYEQCGVSELRQFFVYATNGHEEPGGRWGNPRMLKKLSARSVKDYHGALRTLFQWLVDEGVLSSSPMIRIAPPVHRADQIKPFTDDQVDTLLEAARRSRHAKRDVAIIYLLIDTGLRATELCNIRTGDIDVTGRSIEVLGKGNKRRTIHFGRQAARAVWQYLRETPREPGAPLFIADRGSGAGRPLTRSGLQQMFERLRETTNIRTVRVSAHTCRHYFAVSFLRAGGNAFALQQLLGHTALHQTQKYVALAQGDIAHQHRQFSPADRLRGGNK